MRQRQNRLKLAYAAPGNPKRKKRFARLLPRLLLVIMFAGVLRWAFTYFQIKDVRLEGAEKFDPGTISAACGIEAGESMFFFSAAKAGQALRSLPAVEAAVVTKLYPSTVLIQIEERKAAACIYQDGFYWIVDGHGVPFEQWGNLREGLPVITGLNQTPLVLGQRTADPVIANCLELFAGAVLAVPQLELSELNLADPWNQVLYTSAGNKVLLGDSGDLEQKLRLVWQYQSFAAGDTETLLDLRTGDRIIISGSSAGQL